MKKIFKKALLSVWAMSILMHIFAPLTLVFALENPFDVTFTVEDTEKFKIEKNYDEIKITDLSNNQFRLIKIYSGDAKVATELVEVTCSSLSVCKFSIDGSVTNYKINFDPTFNDITEGENAIDTNTNLTGARDFEIKEHINTPPPSSFNGHAVVIWSCGTGTCYHKFNDIVADPDGITEYKKASTIADDNDSSKKFDVHAQYKGWALEDKFDVWVEAYKTKNSVSTIDWTQVDASTLVGDPPDMREWEDKAEKSGACTKEGKTREEFEACVDQYYIEAGNLPFVKLQPVGEPNEKNAYVSYGDRNFKIAIYNDDFRGLKLGTLDELEYYPAQWADPMLRREGFDISETTKEKPAKMDSILLESTYRFKELSVNNFEVASVEPLDVPEGAVTARKSGDEFVIGFNSNFYDNVVFKITDTDENEYYIQVKRYTVDAWFRNLENETYIYADFYYHNELSYTNFDLTAKIVYKDGTVKNVVLSPYGKVDDGLGNWSAEPEVDVSVQHDPNIPAGKGLKQSAFVYKLSKDEDKKISKIYLNAEYKGSTAETYAGAYVGSGLGTLANIYVEEEA